MAVLIIVRLLYIFNILNNYINIGCDYDKCIYCHKIFDLCVSDYDPCCLIYVKMHYVIFALKYTVITVKYARR